MPPARPSEPAAWRSEIATALAGARAALAASDETPGDGGFWHRMEDQAVARARAARGLAPLDGDAADIDRTVDAITDITERLRRRGGGDPDDHHIGEAQFFLLYYLAAQVHAGAITESDAGAVVEDCWGIEGSGDEHEDEDEDEDPPWEIRRATPTATAGWIDEILGAWREADHPTPLRTADGSPVLATGGDLRESAVILALHRRGAVPPAEAVYALIGVIAEMEEDIAALGPELAELKSTPPLAFVLYYVWAHIVIGHADEDTAMAVVHAAVERLADFGTGGPAPRKGSSRFRRPN